LRLWLTKSSCTLSDRPSCRHNCCLWQYEIL